MPVALIVRVVLGRQQFFDDARAGGLLYFWDFLVVGRFFGQVIRGNFFGDLIIICVLMPGSFGQ